MGIGWNILANNRIVIFGAAGFIGFHLAAALAKNQKSELTVLGKNGKIQNKNSFGNDPNPPKDKKH